MITAIVIGLWGWLFTGPLTEPEQVLAPIKSGLYRVLSRKRPLSGIRLGIYQASVGCGKCHAGWLAITSSVVELHFGNIPDIRNLIVSMATAAILEKWHR